MVGVARGGVEGEVALTWGAIPVAITSNPGGSNCSGPASTGGVLVVKGSTIHQFHGEGSKGLEEHHGYEPELHLGGDKRSNLSCLSQFLDHP